jgi:hypothetical protein
VAVENRQGADGIPAVTGFVSARDNHSLLFSFAGIITINPLTYDKLPYDPVHDVVPVAWVADNFIGIAVPETLKVNSLDDFVKLARSQPGKLNWAASPGVPHYVFAALQKSAGIEMMQVSYRDFRPALQDLGEGRIQAVATGVALLVPQMQAGKVKLLMVNNRQRSPQAPEVPTATEAGYPELTFEGAAPHFGNYVREHNLSHRLRFYAGDFLQDPLPSADVLVFGRVLHNWDLATKRMLLKKAYDALPAGGALIVYERLIDDKRRVNAAALLASVNMVIMTAGGFDFTGADCIGWMREAGFRDMRVELLTSEYSMVVGTK